MVPEWRLRCLSASARSVFEAAQCRGFHEVSEAEGTGALDEALGNIGLLPRSSRRNDLMGTALCKGRRLSAASLPGGWGSSRESREEVLFIAEM